MIYIFILSFIMNLIYFYKNYGGSFKLSCFFIIKTLGFIILFNLIFGYFKTIFNICDLNLQFLIMIYFISLILYLFSKKYACITYGFVISYLSLLGTNNEIFIQGLFMVSVLHIFEGIFVIFNSLFNVSNKSSKIYTPIVINGIPLIFVVFYRRSIFNNYHKLFGIFSGIVILIYGFIAISFTFMGGNVLFEIFLLIILILIHENLYIIDSFIVDLFTKNKIV